MPSMNIPAYVHLDKSRKAWRQHHRKDHWAIPDCLLQFFLQSNWTIRQRLKFVAPILQNYTSNSRSSPPPKHTYTHSAVFHAPTIFGRLLTQFDEQGLEWRHQDFVIVPAFTPEENRWVLWSKMESLLRCSTSVVVASETSLS